MTFLTIPTICGVTGLAIDVGYWHMARRALQNAADAGAIGGALEIVRKNQAGVTSAAKGDASRNGADPVNVTVNNPPTSGPRAGNPDAVEVIINRPMPLFFSSVFLKDPVTIQVRAVATAKIQGGGAFCFIALDSANNPGIGFKNSQAQLTNCGIKSNSNDNRSLAVTGTSLVSVDKAEVSVVGNIFETGGANLDTHGTPPETGSDPAGDPFADVDFPTPLPACSPNPSPIVGGTETLPPGRYCGGLDIQGGATVNFDSGIYFIDGGDFKSVGNSALVGLEVSFVLTGDTPADIGGLFLNTGTQLQFSAPSSGPLEGILFFQDRRALSTAPSNKIVNSQLQTDGAFYFPTQELVLSGGTQVQVSSPGCAGFVARLLTLNAAQIQIDCNGTASSAVILPDESRAKLAE